MGDRTRPESGSGERKLSHVSPEGSARMVDVSDKRDSRREAVAAGSVRVSPEALEAVRSGRNAKGNVIETARLAGILAAKRTSDLIPLCHPIRLDHVDVSIVVSATGFEIEATVAARGPTGVEMEALAAVSVAALTLYDMVKAADKTMVIDRVRLLRKTGGRSGPFVRDDERARPTRQE